MNTSVSILRFKEFMKAIQSDGRIGATHIAIYAALLMCWRESYYSQPLIVYSYEVMKIAKIRAPSTYYSALADLHDLGYLRYEPSFNKYQGSRIYLNQNDG
jgi:hypothetical protein